MPSASARDGDDGPGHHGQHHDHQVVPEGLDVLIAVGGEALEVVFEKEFAEEGGILMLDGNEPGQHHGEIEDHAGPPKGAVEDGPFAAQKGKGGDDDDGQKGRYRSFGKRGQAGEEVDVIEPEFGIGFVPGIPAEQADGQRRGHLHIGGSASGKADDAGASDSNEGGIQVAARPKSPHVQVDEAHHDEGEGGGGQASAPVVDAEILKEEHGAPVVKCRFLQARDGRRDRE